MNKGAASEKGTAALLTPANFRSDKVTNIGAALNAFVADLFALYMKTKNVHWHMSSLHFRDYGLLLDEQARQIYATTDSIGARIQELGATTFCDYHLLLDEQSNQIKTCTEAIAEHVKKLETKTLPPTGHRSRPRRWPGNDTDYSLREMLAELWEDNLQLAASLRRMHRDCEEYADVATASRIETWTNQAERRVLFLEAIRDAEAISR